MKHLFFCILLFLLVQTKPESFAQKVIQLTDDTEVVCLEKYMMLHQDHTSQKNIQEIDNPKNNLQFSPYEQNYQNFYWGLFGKKVTHWIKFKLQYKKENKKDIHKDWILLIDYPMLDKVNFYVKNSKNEWKIFKAGNKVPLPQRTVKTRLPTLEIETTDTLVHTYYIEIQSEGVLQIPLLLSSQQYFFDKSIKGEVLFGFFVGLISILLGISIIMYFYTLSQGYLLFAFYLIISVNLYTHTNGYIAAYWYPDIILLHFANHLSVAWAYLLQLSLIFFTINFIQTTKHLIKHTITLFALFSNILGFLTLFFLPFELLAIIFIVFSVLSRLWLWVVSFKHLKEDLRLVFFYLAVTGLFYLLGIFCYTIQIFNLISFLHFNIFHFIAIFLLLEACFLGLALIHKNNYIYQEMNKAEQNAMIALQKSKDNLEFIVQERTNAIEKTMLALQEKEQLFRNLVETMQAGVFIHQDFNFKYINQYLADMLGYPINELYTKDITQIIHPDYVNLVKDRYTQRIKGRNVPQRYDIQVINKQNEVLWLDLSIIKVEYAGSFALLGTVYDITSTKNMNEQLAQQNLALAETIDNHEKMQYQLIENAKMSALGKLVANVAHELNTPLAAIRSSVQSLQRALERIIQDLQPILQLLSPSKRIVFFDLLSKIKFQDNYLSSQEKRKVKEGWVVILHENKVLHIRRIAEILMNVTADLDIRQLMPLLRHKNSLEIFLFINNLSNLVRGSLNIDFASEQASKTVSALKTYARQEYSTEKTEINLKNNIESVLALHRHHIKYGIEVVVDVQEYITINCYADEITQVWSNLINNALQAMNYKGELLIKAEEVLRENEHHICISFKDTGGGIPENIQQNIFEPFFTTKPVGVGNGLGLDIIKKIVDKHKGKIFFTTEVGIGTTFFVELPN